MCREEAEDSRNCDCDCCLSSIDTRSMLGLKMSAPVCALSSRLGGDRLR